MINPVAWWRRLWPAPVPPPLRVETVAPKPLRMTASFVERVVAKPEAEHVNPFVLPTYAPGVRPAAQAKIAMDSGSALAPVAAAWGWAGHGLYAEGVGFLGYPYLAELVQRPEYRIPSEVIAEEMTRKWIRVTATGSDEDKSEKIKEIEADLIKFRVQQTFRDAITLDGYFGMSMIAIDLGRNDDNAEIRTPLLIDKRKIAKDSLKGFRVVDPTWVSPNLYNATDPLAKDFYRPTTWFIMGRETHASRLLILVSRPVPDILKPAYNFGGTSLSQMLKPYADNWLRTRQSVADLISAFSQFVLSTNLMSAVQDNGPDGLNARMALWSKIRDNRDLLLIDKEHEKLENISAPLGTLDALQAQAQEHMSAVSRIPLVKAFGITPTGLNASTDGEIRVFYDTIHAAQERVCTDPVTTVLQLIQLNRYGEIDPEIGHEYVPLWELDEAGEAAVRKTDADTDAVLIESNVITTDEARTRLAASRSSPYAGLKGSAPEPEPGATELHEPLTDPSERIAAAGERGEETGANEGV